MPRTVVTALCRLAGVSLVGVVLALGGCASWFAGEEQAPPVKVEVVRPPVVVPEAAPPPTPPSPAPPPPTAAPPPLPSLEDVFFAFDRADLRADAKAALDRDVAILKAHPRLTVVVEGHCDERGTLQYNLALGERRARAVRDYLVAAGIAAGRVQTISYGEERPFVLGHDESAWRWNRRAHLVPRNSRR